MVEADARLLRPVQIPQHPDRRCGGLLQPADRQKPDADLRSIPAAGRASGARIAVPGWRRRRFLPMEGRRQGVCHAGEGRTEDGLEYYPADDGMEDLENRGEE